MICALVALLVWPLVFGIIALACGIPAYLRGAERGRDGVIVAIIAIGRTFFRLLF